MRRLKKTNKWLGLSDYGIPEKFDTYELGDYDFSSDLDFHEIAAVYIFTERDNYSSSNPSFEKEMYKHTLIYCGMTGNTNERFKEHFHKNEILGHKANRISLCFCKNEDDAKSLERSILETFSFPVNERGNESPKYPDVTQVWEEF